MDYRALQAEILSGPKAAQCAPFVNDGSDSSRKATAAADDKAIAEILSVGRMKVVSREVGDGAISLALGVPAGPVFLYKLRRLAATVLPDAAADDQIAQVAIADQA